MDEILNEIHLDDAKRGDLDKFILTQGIWTMSEKWKADLAALVAKASENEKQRLVGKLSQFLQSEQMGQRTAAVYVLGLLEHRARNLVPEIVEARKGWQDQVATVQTDVALEVANALPKICTGKELSSVLLPLILNIVQHRTYKNVHTNILSKNDERELAELAKFTTDFKSELVEALISVLRSDYLAHRVNAAYMLGLLGPDARTAIPAMIEAMNGALGNIEWSVVEALPKIGAIYALPELIRSLGQAPTEGATSWDSKLQDSHIIACLAALGPAASSAAPRLMPYLGSYAAEQALTRMGLAVVPVMLEYVQREDTRHAWVYSNAAKVIEGIGPQAIQFLNELLRSNSVKNRPALLAVFNSLPANLNVNLTPTGPGEKLSEVLANDRILEDHQFKAGTKITTRNDGALIEAKLKEETTLGGSKYGAGTQLTFSGNSQGELVKAVIVGEHDIQGVRLNAGNRPITLEFVKSRQQLRPSLKSATSSGAPLVANDVPFKQDTPLLFYRPGHLGAGNLQHEVLVDGLWFGPRPQQAQPVEAESITEAGMAVRVSMTFPPPAIERDYDIGFYTTGRVAYGTLSRRQHINGFHIEAHCPVFLYANGQLFGGTLVEETVIDGIPCSGAFRLEQNGKLLAGVFANEQSFDGIRCVGQFKLYADGKLLGGTLASKQAIGPVTCEGHFSLHPNGMPNRIYLGTTDEELGHPYNEGWLLRLSAQGHVLGYQASSPGYWRKESIDFVGAGFSDFFSYYDKLAAVCENAQCRCHRYDAMQPYTFSSEIRGYMQKGWALMNKNLFAEAEAVQTRALELAIKYRHTFGGDQLTELCMDIARRLVSEGRLDDALAMLEQAHDYWQEYGKGRRNNKVQQCAIDFRKSQIYWQQKDFSKLESVLTPLVAFCHSAERHDSLQYYDFCAAEKMLGDCFVERGDLALAEVHYKEALSVNPYEYLCVDVMRAYQALLLRMEQSGRAADMAARIKNIEQQPRMGNFCGMGQMQEQSWLSWQPTLDL